MSALHNALNQLSVSTCVLTIFTKLTPQTRGRCTTNSKAALQAGSFYQVCPKGIPGIYFDRGDSAHNNATQLNSFGWAGGYDYLLLQELSGYIMGALVTSSHQ
jgi:hypothetical protein